MYAVVTALLVVSLGRQVWVLVRDICSIKSCNRAQKLLFEVLEGVRNESGNDGEK